jgi:hypothetical protein
VYRLRERRNEIEIWNVLPGLSGALAAGEMVGKLPFGKATSRGDEKCLSVIMESSEEGNATTYTFYFAGVQVSRFKLAVSPAAQSLNDDFELNFLFKVLVS